MTTMQLILSRRVAAILAATGFILGLAAAAQAQTVRDHRRDQPKVRDHRKPAFCFSGISGPPATCHNIPYSPYRTR